MGQLVCEAFRLRLTHRLFGSFVDGALDTLTTDYSFATYLVMMRETFWPLGVFQEE